MERTQAGIRERILGVLDWALPVFRPGCSAHGELSGLAGRLRDPSVPLRALAGMDEHRVRQALAGLSRHAGELAGAVERLPVQAGLDRGAAEAVRAGVEAMADALRATVTYGEVVRVLQGSWGDDDLGKATRDLIRDIEALASEPMGDAPAGPGAA
jgi:hypothetical protein